ncbi:NAD(P)-binding protein [Meredithblackwellia eburnea MCA 4105]
MSSLIKVDPSKFGSLKGRTAVITGGSSGLGHATALLLHSLDANVVVADLSPPPASTTPSAILFVKTDATIYSDLLNLFRKAEARFGAWPDIVFANAGISERGDLFAGATDDDIEIEPKHEVLDLDIKAVANTVRIAYWGIKKSGKPGNIIMTASLAGYQGQPGLAMYNAAKHGVVGLLRGLRPTCLKDGVSVSLLAPAITSTPILSTQKDSFAEVSRQLTNAGVPLNQPIDVARAFVHILNQSPSRANGMGVLIQGGLYTDLEFNVAKSRKYWMGEEMAKLYTGGKGFNVFEKLMEEGPALGKPKL